ncbi:hypothetical protein M2650_03170 [Luteimonas sp. SX5]|uniref:Uncharacterized protein n=1 Tax=Luteimonas galliterrae TaxID=2940486 RepID=A0ABT0MFJ5_9GAMM|nr:hypothetical protein [Luteimonas galliterrae]MCL1633645.1 hypothetical protein [Luteimonas galliterrae]
MADNANQARDASEDASRESALPWSITLPVAVGVFLGAMLLGLLLLAYANGQKNIAETTAAETRPQRSLPAAGSAEAVVPPAVVETASVLPKLPGLIEANRLRLKTACIAGTVGHRRSNGWVQAVDDNAPRRCVATSQ